MKVTQSYPTLRPHGLYSPWNSLGQNIGVGSLSLFQGIFPTQGLNPGLPHCRWILYQLSHRGSPGVSCIADGFFIKWAIGEAKLLKSIIELILCKSYVFTKCRKFWKNKCFLLDFIWFDIYTEREGWSGNILLILKILDSNTASKFEKRYNIFEK